MRNRLSIILFWIAAVIMIISGVSALILPSDGYEHQGVILLDNQQEYNEFKIELSNPQTIVKDLHILNESYPKLISFDYISQTPFQIANEKVDKLRNQDYVPFMFFALPFFAVGVFKWHSKND